MPAEIDPTEARSREVDEMWKRLEEQMAQFDRDKDEFAREFVVEFEQYIMYFSKQAQEAEASADSDAMANLEQQRQKMAEEFETELAQARARHVAEKQLNMSPGKRRRVRNMV